MMGLKIEIREVVWSMKVECGKSRKKLGFLYLFMYTHLYIYIINICICGIVEIEVVNPNHNELRKVGKRRLICFDKRRKLAVGLGERSWKMWVAL